MSDTQQRTNAYPQPPFPEQPQTPPGLASEMQPVPDHGETSYKGHGRLAGKKALITGGDSGIGRAVAIAYAREGADVAINYLPEEECELHTLYFVGIVVPSFAGSKKCVPYTITSFIRATVSSNHAPPDGFPFATAFTR